jgi:thiol-disulfide isomerase/thioredoxin
MNLQGQGYRISVHVPDLPSTDLILAHRIGLKFYTDDTLKTQGDGRLVFKGDSLLPQGMYQLVFPDKKYVEFFLGPIQFFEIRTLGSALTDSLSFTGSPENSHFIDWQRKYSAIRNRTAYLQEKIRKGNLSADSIQIINRELRSIQMYGNHVWDEAIKNLDETAAGSFVRGMRPVRLPDSLVSLRTQEGQYKQYLYFRTHFFDDVNFSDERMLRTPLLESKLDQYFNQIVPPYPDSIIRDARIIIDRSRVKPDVFRFVVQYLLNLYSDPKVMGTDAVYVYLAENYYLNGQATWIDSVNLQGIRVRVTDLKPLILGAPAPVLPGLINTKSTPVSIDTLKADYLVLFFWDPGCSHCKEVLPKLFLEYPGLQKLGCEVIAVDTHAEKDPWIKYIEENNLTWINVYSPVYYREILNRYQVFTTPRIFILDKDRKIIGKDLAVEQIKPFIEQTRSMDKR